MEMEINLDRIEQFDKEFAKQFGDTYTGFNAKESFENVARVPLKSLSLNRVLGGGIPVGRIIEIFGQNSCGKSTVCNHIVSSYQEQGKLCMWIDAEESMDPQFMSYCGVDMNKLCRVRPETAEAALEAIRTGIKAIDSEGNRVVDLIILDSIASLIPKEETEKEFGGGTVAHLARLLSQSLKQIANLAGKNGVSVVLINQERATNLLGLQEIIYAIINK